jgi:epoxyqueuosine reductase
VDSGRDAVALSAVASAERVRVLALEAGFDLCGFARPEPIPPAALLDWLAAGMAADMDWLAQRAADRLDPLRLLPDARTVVALGCNYWTEAGAGEGSPISRYARGRDYHATLRDRLRTFRRLLRAEWPALRTYGSVDHGPFMEKVWAARAGLGVVARNGCLVTPRFGSWVVLTGGARGRRLRRGADGRPVRNLPAVRGRMPDGCAGRRRPGRCAGLPLVPDHRERGSGPLRAPRGHGGARVRVRRVPRRLSPQRRPAAGDGPRFLPRAVAELDARGSRR